MQIQKSRSSLVFAKINQFKAVFQMKNPMAGFTLVELLVVMTIIAILAAVGLGNYTRSLSRGRDANRRSNLKTIQNALEQYYLSKGNTYPGDATGQLLRTDSDLLNFFSEGQMPQTTDGTDYCNGNDDSNSGQSPGFVYPTGYWCCEKLEQAKGNATWSSGNEPTPSASGDYFCIYNLQ